MFTRKIIITPNDVEFPPFNFFRRKFKRSEIKVIKIILPMWWNISRYLSRQGGWVRVFYLDGKNEKVAIQSVTCYFDPNKINSELIKFGYDTELISLGVLDSKVQK